MSSCIRGKGSIALSMVSAIIISCAGQSYAAVKREELVFASVPVIYTASKIEQPVTEAPAMVDVITAKDIDDLGLRTLADALRLIPGMDVTDIVIGVNFSMRGLNGRQMNNTTLVLMDGHPFNEIMGGVSDPTCIPLNNVSRIEVVRGPGSALYGANALTGVINVITKTPDEVNSVQVGGGIGTEELRNTDKGGIVRKFGDRVEQSKETLLAGRQFGDLGFVTSYWHFKDNSVGGGRSFPTDDRDSTEYYGKVLYKNLTIAYNHFAATIGIPNQNPFDGSLLSDKAETSFTRDFVSANYQQQLGEKLTIDLRTHFYKTSQTDDYTDIDLTTFELVSVSRPIDAKRFGGELQATYKAGESNTLVGGYERRDEYSDSPDVGGSKRITTDSLYLQDEWRPFKKLILTLGARYDQANAYKKKVSPRFSIVYALSDRTSFRASYGEAYRAPNFMELYADIWQTGRYVHIKGNPDIQPEELKTYDAGVMHSFNNHLQLTGDLFYTEIRNRIIPLYRFVPDPLQPLGMGQYYEQYYGTKELAVIKGGEVSLKYNYAFFNSALSYAYEEAFDEKDDFRLAYTPYKLNLRLGFDMGRGFGLNTFSYFISENKFNETDYTDNIFVTNAKLSWKATDALAFGLIGYNVFDRRYSEAANMPVGGRSVMVDASYRFGL